MGGRGRGLEGVDGWCWCSRVRVSCGCIAGRERVWASGAASSDQATGKDGSSADDFPPLCRFLGSRASDHVEGPLYHDAAYNARITISDHPNGDSTTLNSAPLFAPPSAALRLRGFLTCCSFLRKTNRGVGRVHVSRAPFETFLQRFGLRVRAEGGSRRKTGSVGRMDLGGRHGMAWRWIEGFFYLVGPVGSQDRKKGVGVVPSSRSSCRFSMLIA
jgi:hypothetical protein